MKAIADVPGHPAPPGAPDWLAELIEHTIARWCPMEHHPGERMKWVTARIVAASTLPEERQQEIRGILAAPRKRTPKRGRR